MISISILLEIDFAASFEWREPESCRKEKWVDQVRALTQKHNSSGWRIYIDPSPLFRPDFWRFLRWWKVAGLQLLPFIFVLLLFFPASFYAFNVKKKDKSIFVSTAVQVRRWIQKLIIIVQFQQYYYVEFIKLITLW